MMKHFLFILFVFFASSAVVLASDEMADVSEGVFLVANEQLKDPRFKETVILLIHNQSQEGSVGLIVNRPSNISLNHALPTLGNTDDHPENIYIGGPVQFRSVISLLVRAVDAPKGMKKVFADVYHANGLNNVDRIMRTTEQIGEFRTFGGYAGWAPGQLQKEIDMGTWHVFKASPEQVFSLSPEDIWQDFLRRMDEWDWVKNRFSPGLIFPDIALLSSL